FHHHSCAALTLPLPPTSNGGACADLRSPVYPSSMPGTKDRRFPIGAEITAAGQVDFRVWAPKCSTVDVVLENGGAAEPVRLDAEGNGYFSGVVESAGPGSRYRYRLD